jgi:F-type H+-transporting ATPase subunit gamma
MANVLDLRRRIRSVKNTRQLTKAMKMVSAAKLRRAQERAITARPYAQMLSSVLRSLVRRADAYDVEEGGLPHPLLAKRPEKRAALVVVTGDKGFAGAFNVNVLKATQRFLDETQTDNLEIDLEVVGRKGRDALRRRFPVASVPGTANQRAPSGNRGARVVLTGEHVGVLAKLNFDEIARMAQGLIDRFVDQEIDAVYLVFNEFKSVIAQRIVVERVLPIMEVGEQDLRSVTEMEREVIERMAEAAASSQVSLLAPDTREADEEARKFGTAQVDYIYEQGPKGLMHALLPHYVSVQLYHAMLESVAAEHAARMTAMDSASNNASDMIDSLTLKMNRVRQAAITKEIIEIVSGAAAQ